MSIKVLLLTKDEHDMIEDFISYYSYLFGMTNLVIVDNNSTNQHVLDVYEKYKQQGMTVITEVRPFGEANQFMTQHIHQLIQRCPDTEWVLCFETDEFMFWTSDMNAVIEPQTIRNYFMNEIPEDVTYLRYEKFWGSIVDPEQLGDHYKDGVVDSPILHLTKFYNQNWDKFAVRAKAFVAITQWFHQASVSYGKPTVCKELGLLHYHNTGKQRIYEKACRVMESLGVTKFNKSSEDVLRNVMAFPNGAAHAHKAAYIIDVLLRSICWHMYVQAHGVHPTKDFVAAAIESKNLEFVKQQVATCVNVAPNGDPFAACVYVEDVRPVEFEVRSVANTMRHIRLLPK